MTQGNFPGGSPREAPPSPLGGQQAPKGPRRVSPGALLPQPTLETTQKRPTQPQNRAQRDGRRHGPGTAGDGDQAGREPGAWGGPHTHRTLSLGLCGFLPRVELGACCRVSGEGVGVGRVCSVPGEPAQAARDSLKTGQYCGKGPGRAGCPDCPHSVGLAARGHKTPVISLDKASPRLDHSLGNRSFNASINLALLPISSPRHNV